MTARIRGYTDRPSAAPGERIQFHLSSLEGSALTRTLRIFRCGLAETEVASAAVTIPAQPVPAGGWGNNRWAPVHALTIADDWRSGVYFARAGAPGDDAQDTYFVVRNAQPSAAVPIVVQVPTTTMNAYTNWGARSLYTYNSGNSPAHAVSFDRPLQKDPAWPRGYGFEDEWELRIRSFAQWLELAGIGADFITNADLHRCATLRPYRLFVSVGHDEYWSREMRDRFDQFVAGGGNAAILGGNTCFWQIRLEPDPVSGTPDRVQVCYKSAPADPCADPALKTVQWRATGRPENLSFGAGCAAGAWQGPGAPGAFTVMQPDHWVFAGTQLRRCDTFGNEPDGQLLRYESNGVRAGDGTPPEYLILAFAELRDWGQPGNAALGVLARDGQGIVFNAATTEWARGLDPCLAARDPLRSAAGRITHNVIRRLGSGPR